MILCFVESLISATAGDNLLKLLGQYPSTPLNREVMTYIRVSKKAFSIVELIRQMAGAAELAPPKPHARITEHGLLYEAQTREEVSKVTCHIAHR